MDLMTVSKIFNFTFVHQMAKRIVLPQMQMAKTIRGMQYGKVK